MRIHTGRTGAVSVMAACISWTIKWLTNGETFGLIDISSLQPQGCTEYCLGDAGVRELEEAMSILLCT